jgi:oligoribonuclease NrnB/cAMP/cGMP phosphodiesterase (DHH superfamily)
MKPIVILYHNDQDGFGAAYAAWRKFKIKASYVPVQYRGKDFAPKNLKNKEIYLLDICYDAKTMRNLLNNNKRVVVIDHHIGRKNEVKISTGHLFDLKHSAAVLSWKYFHPQKNPPRLLRHIEDYDLWKFNLPRTKEIIASLYTYSENFKIWDQLVADFEKVKKRNKYINEGKAILKYQDSLIKEIIGYGEKVIFEGHSAFAVNSSVLRSELGDYIKRNKKALGIIWAYRNGIFKCSARGDGRINLNELVKKLGGGGHKAAAGFTFKSSIKFPWKRIK